MKEMIYRTLIERGYSEHNANLMLNDLENLSSPLDKLLQEWIDSENQQPDFVYENYSLHQFQNERKMEYPAALLTMIIAGFVHAGLCSGRQSTAVPS